MAIPDLLRSALENLPEDPRFELVEGWTALFGKSFPLPGPQGGDRARGFASPAVPAAPKTDRFA